MSNDQVTAHKKASTNIPSRNLAVDLRPQSFKEYIGSVAIVNQIRSQLDSGHIPTAILLSGSTGCGKTTLARCISESVNGELVEINAAHETGVDAARELGESAAFRPLMGKFKVIVLDEAHQLTKQAQIALLKHVEDAAPSTIWIFCTTEPSKLLPTLRGRCLSYALGNLKAEETGRLVHRAFNHLKKEINEKTKEFIETLVRENITSPRAILMATEQFVGGMDPLACIIGTQDSPEAFEIARATYKQDWKDVRVRLAKATAEEAMTIRIVCVNYLKSALLKDNDTTFNRDAILELTKTIPFDGPLCLAELSCRLYNICVQLDRRGR